MIDANAVALRDQKENSDRELARLRSVAEARMVEELRAYELEREATRQQYLAALSAEQSEAARIVNDELQAQRRALEQRAVLERQEFQAQLQERLSREKTLAEEAAAARQKNDSLRRMMAERDEQAAQQLRERDVLAASALQEMREQHDRERRADIAAQAALRTPKAPGSGNP